MKGEPVPLRVMAVMLLILAGIVLCTCNAQLEGNVDLPDDVLGLIAGHVQSSSDIANFMLTSSEYHHQLKDRMKVRELILNPHYCIRDYQSWCQLPDRIQ